MGGVMWLTLPTKNPPDGGFLAQVLATASQQMSFMMAAADNVIKTIGER
jgi:hypothetical protein